MTKTLYVITKSNFGGAQRYVYELATKLPKDQFTAEVALGGDGILKTMLIEAGIPVHSISGAARDIDLFKEVKVLWNLYKIFKNSKPDIVHLNSSKIGGLGAVAAQLAGVKKVIFTNHGWAFKEHRPALQTALIKVFTWLTVMFNDTTIVLSELEKQYVRSWPFVPKKLVLIPNGLLPFELLSREEALEKLVGAEVLAKIQSENIRVVGTIAELTKNKGLMYAVEGLALLNDPKTMLIIIGEGEERTALEAAISKNNLEGKVILAGSVDNARTYLKAFEFFILPSVKEGLPYAILEAGYARLPVIASNVGGIPEMISDHVDGLLMSPRRPQEIKHALIYIENHADDVIKFSDSLYKRVTTVYSFEKMLKSIQDLYKA